MKKPKKIDLEQIPTYECGFKEYDRASGYNEACEDWEKYSKEVITVLVKGLKDIMTHQRNTALPFTSYSTIYYIAEKTLARLEEL